MIADKSRCEKSGLMVQMLLTFGASLVRKSFPHCSSRFGSRFIGEFIGLLVGWLMHSSDVRPSDTYIAPLGLWGICLSVYYRDVAPLGLNERLNP